MKFEQVVMYLGFVAIIAGIAMMWGPGAAVLVAGLILFVSGGFVARERK